MTWERAATAAVLIPNRARLLWAFVELQKRERRYGGIREGGPEAQVAARVAGT